MNLKEKDISGLTYYHKIKEFTSQEIGRAYYEHYLVPDNKQCRHGGCRLRVYEDKEVCYLHYLKPEEFYEEEVDAFSCETDRFQPR